MQILLDHGADVNAQYRQGRLTQLHVAAHEDSTKVAQLLLEYDADLLKVCAKGVTPFETTKLHAASKEMMSMLDLSTPEHSAGKTASQTISRSSTGLKKTLSTSSTGLGLYSSAFTGTMLHALKWWNGSRR